MYLIYDECFHGCKCEENVWFDIWQAFSKRDQHFLSDIKQLQDLYVSKEMIFKMQRALRILLFIAATMLVGNDVARLVISLRVTHLAAKMYGQDPQEEKNASNSLTLFEEEVKHKEFSPYHSLEFASEESLEVSVAHLIKDDEVRHLAFIAIFSPPPNLA